MALYPLTTATSQSRPHTALYPLTMSKGLRGHLDLFLIASKVDGLSDFTLKYYRYQLGRFVDFCLGQGAGEVRDVSPSIVRLFFLKLQETNKPYSLLTYHKAIKRFFNWLVVDGILAASPMVNIKAPRCPQYVVKPFTGEEIHRLLAVCAGPRLLDYRNKALVLMFLDTGLRLNEMAGIQLADINFDRETVKVTGKGAKERFVRVGRETQKALLHYILQRKDDLPCLWVTEEVRPLTREGVKVTIRILCHRAEITREKRGPHTFRHTFATASIRNGANLFYVQSLLGHSTLSMVRRYSKSIDSEDAVKAHVKFSPVDNMKI